MTPGQVAQRILKQGVGGEGSCFVAGRDQPATLQTLNSSIDEALWHLNEARAIIVSRFF
jgi:hypothetical protein